MKAILVITTTDSEQEANSLAKSLLEAELAACINILPRITSIFYWENQIQSSNEWLLMIKTGDHLYPQVENFLKEHHSYDVPECLCIPCEKIESEFLSWMIGSVKAAQK